MSEMVPEGWGLIPLKDVCFFQEGPGLRNWQYRDHGIKFINIRCIKDGDIDTSVAQHLSSEEVEEKYQHFLLDEGDYVLSSSGTIGRLARVKRRHLPLLLNTSVIRFRSLDDTKLDSLYLRHFLQSRQFFDKISEQSQGSAQVNFGPTHLNVLDAVLPPLPEQKKIASILTSVDEVIVKTQSQIDKLQDLKKGTMNELLTKGIGHTEFKDSELGRIPRSWEVNFCDKICQRIMVGIVITPSAYYTDSGVPVFRSANIGEEGINFDNLKYMSSESNEILGKSKIEIGDVLTVRTGYPGTSAVVEENAAGGNCVDVIISRPQRNIIKSEYLCNWINSDYGKSEVLNKQGGLAQQHFNVGDLRELKVLVPTLEEQIEILDIIKSITVQLKLTKQKLHQTQSLKKSLMQDLLTGKVRVSVN